MATTASSRYRTRFTASPPRRDGPGSLRRPPDVGQLVVQVPDAGHSRLSQRLHLDAVFAVLPPRRPHPVGHGPQHDGRDQGEQHPHQRGHRSTSATSAQTSSASAGVIPPLP